MIDIFNLFFEKKNDWNLHTLPVWRIFKAILTGSGFCVMLLFNSKIFGWLYVYYSTTVHHTFWFDWNPLYFGNEGWFQKCKMDWHLWQICFGNKKIIQKFKGLIHSEFGWNFCCCCWFSAQKNKHYNLLQHRKSENFWFVCFFEKIKKISFQDFLLENKIHFNSIRNAGLQRRCRYHEVLEVEEKYDE